MLKRFLILGLFLFVTACSDNEDYSCVAAPPKTTTEIPDGCHATSLP